MDALRVCGGLWIAFVALWLIWALRTKRLAEVRRHLDQISQRWDAALDRLRAFVEMEEQ